MASFNIHIAVAKRYSEKNNIKDLESFYNGTIDPDLAVDKNISHYTGTRNKDDLLDYLKWKVQLPQFLLENNIDSDYKKGVFLHLVTDYIFFNDFFDKDYLKNISYNDFIKDLYYSYDCSNIYINDKYELDIKEIEDKINNNIAANKKEKNTDLVEGNLTNLLEQDKLDCFIERVSDIDLEKYQAKLLVAKENILP